MKKIFLSSLVLVFASLSFAGNEGPQAGPPYRATIIAERTVGGGYPPPPGHSHGRSIQITDDGTVLKAEWFVGEQDPRITHVMKLTVKQLTKLQKNIQSIQPGDLIEPNPEQRGCYDAPTSTDRVYKSGLVIKIAQKAACKQYTRENAKLADRKVINLLNALEELVRQAE
ncbi:hypothetical protein [Bdellovibrio sp. HCB337]|uniref:hypothetical protein n=1 Tax=Bdellovibrio sp. HCB337 TaxID=3394358 RepID=UPI0039A6700E